MAVHASYVISGTGENSSGARSYEDERPYSNRITVGYFRKLRTGEILPIHDWKRVFRDRVGGGVNLVLRKTRPGYPDQHLSISGSLDYWRDPIEPTPWPTTTEVNAMIAAAAVEAKANAKTAAWDVGTFLAESHKSYDLVRNAHNRTFARAGNILSRRGPGRVIRTIREFSEAWMEYRYGWRILMYDLESAQDSVQRLSRKTSQLDRSTAFRQATVRSSRVRINPTWLFPGRAGGFGTTDWFHTVQSEEVVRNIDIRVGCGVDSSLLPGFTINPFLTGWELIPFSFVLDWFVNTGDLIGALTPTLGRDVKYLWASVRREDLRAFTSTGKLYHPGSWRTELVSGNLGFKKAESLVNYERYPLQDPGFHLEFRPRMNLAKWADLGALTLLRKDALFRSLHRR